MGQRYFKLVMHCMGCKYLLKNPLRCHLGCAIENYNRNGINRPMIFGPTNKEYCREQRKNNYERENENSGRD